MDAKLIHPKKREPKVKLSEEERHERRKEKQREWNKTHKEVIAKSTNKCIKKGLIKAKRQRKAIEHERNEPIE